MSESQEQRVDHDAGHWLVEAARAIADYNAAARTFALANYRLGPVLRAFLGCDPKQFGPVYDVLAEHLQTETRRVLNGAHSRN